MDLPQYRDHRACRPRQRRRWSDNLLKQSGALPRRNQAVAERGQWTATPRARARHHDLRQTHLGSNEKGHAHQHRRHPRPTPISAARWSGSCRWWMVWFLAGRCGPKARCRRPSSSPPRRWPLGLRPIVVLNKVDKTRRRARPRPRTSLRPFRRAGCRRETSSISRISTPAAAPAGPDGTLEGPRKDSSRRPLRLVVRHVPAPRPDRPRGPSPSACSPPRSAPNAFHRAHPDGPRRIRTPEGRLRRSRALFAHRRPDRTVPVTKIMAFRGSRGQQPIDEAIAGDIVTPFAGMSKATVADTPPATFTSTPPARTAHRPADHHRDLRHQRQPACGPRRQEGAKRVIP